MTMAALTPPDHAPMTTQDLIAKIDRYAAVFEPLMKPNNLPHMHLMPTDLKDIPAQQFLELCEHYKSDPFVSALPTVWLKVGALEVYVSCEYIGDASPKKSDALEELRSIINPAPQHA